MYVTDQRVRIEAGMQQRYSRQPFRSDPDGSETDFYVESDDRHKIVPEFSTGNTMAGVSDVKVYCGLSGVAGASRMGIDEVDSETGRVTLGTAPDSGCSLIVTYSSSALSHEDIDEVRTEAEGIINNRLSKCYDLPLGSECPAVDSMSARLSTALIWIRGYGTGGRERQRDGEMLYSQLMGSGARIQGKGKFGTQRVEVGEIGYICTPGFSLVDDGGNVIDRNDDDAVSNAVGYKAGGRVTGRLYDITEEEFRYKEPQADADTDQPGSART
jgi:hypothetical protein